MIFQSYLYTTQGLKKEIASEGHARVFETRNTMKLQ